VRALVRVLTMIVELIAAIQSLPAKPDWIVFLCPTVESALQHSRMLAVLLPKDAKFSGRTAVLRSHRISVAAVSEEVFVPPASPFLLKLFGWDQTSAEETTEWQTRSAGWLP